MDDFIKKNFGATGATLPKGVEVFGATGATLPKGVEVFGATYPIKSFKNM